MRADLVLIALHVAANMVWVGALLASVLVVVDNGGPVAGQVRLARTIYARLAVPAFLLSFVLGAARLGMDWRSYLVTTHFMHAKLALAFVAIVAHHWIGALLKRLTDEPATAGRMLKGLAYVFGIACLGSVVLVVMRPL